MKEAQLLDAECVLARSLSHARRGTAMDEALVDLVEAAGTGSSLREARSRLVESHDAASEADPLATKAFELLTAAVRRASSGHS
jgi:hypothetical protein